MPQTEQQVDEKISQVEWVFRVEYTVSKHEMLKCFSVYLRDILTGTQKQPTLM